MLSLPSSDGSKTVNFLVYTRTKQSSVSQTKGSLLVERVMNRLPHVIKLVQSLAEVVQQRVWLSTHHLAKPGIRSSAWAVATKSRALLR